MFFWVYLLLLLKMAVKLFRNFALINIINLLGIFLT